jgi:hypothetical protein
LALAESFGANDFTSTPAAGVRGKRSNAEVGPPETVGKTEVKTQLATANGVRTLENMMLAEGRQEACERRMKFTSVLEFGFKPPQLKRNIQSMAKSTILEEEDFRTNLQRSMAGV